MFPSCILKIKKILGSIFFFSQNFVIVATFRAERDSKNNKNVLFLALGCETTNQYHSRQVKTQNKNTT